ncbi:MAG: pyridoxal phosphate-dependent aminotransferase family protein [Treponema sp.]|nr:pyridoxal phosphate-dependent aminotransferase family protein [Treponema sp.]
MKISEIKDELEKIRESQNFRSVSDIRMISATRGVDENQKEYIVFSSNNYLGLSHEKSVIEAAKNALSFGTGSTGSRLTSGSSFELSRLEKNLASFKQTQDAVVFGTDYITNLGVLSALDDKKSLVISDQLNHASIIDGCKISGAKVYVYRHNDMNHLEKLLEESQDMVAEEGFQRFLVTDGVFSMDGDVANLPDLAALKEKYGFCLIVDEAHALGVIGEKGRGTEEYFGLHGKIDVQIGTLSKALASEGGYVAASHEICDFLRNKSRPFIFSTALPPSVAAAADQALSLLREYGSAYMEKSGKTPF